MQDINKEIFIKAQEGDLSSFEIIYKETSGFVYNVALRVVANKQDAEEVTQEVFLRVYHSLKKFRFQSSFKTWVYRITMNCAINHLRKISRENVKKVSYKEDLDIFGAKPGEQDIDGSRDNKEKMVNFLLKNLNSDQRTCVILRNIEGLSYQEIADVLKTNINTVRTRLKRAREKMLSLRKEVYKYEF